MDAVNGFSIKVEHDARGAVVRISGDLDLASASTLRECLADLDDPSVTLDFTNCTFMDSSGISVLVWRHRHGEMVLRGVQPSQMEVLQLVGLDRVFVFDSD